MTFVNHKVKVDAPVDRVWSLLLHKIRHPDLYVPGIVKVEILNELGAFAVERRMETDRGKSIHEVISADELTKCVIFKYKTDPVFSGYVLNMVHEEEDGTYLEYALHWTPKPGTDQTETDAFWAETIKNAVLHAKRIAESPEPATIVN